MSAVAERFRNVAAGFTDRADAVPDSAWDNPTPCEGWVARDVVRHLAEWMPGFFLGSAGLAVPTGPSVDDDVTGAWRALRDALQAALDDPEIAPREYDSPAGRMTVEHAIDQFGISDILVHTWDLARSTGLDETLDADEVGRAVRAMAPHDEAMRKGGHYGPRVDVPDDADDQTKLLAFSGRRP
ncbi:MAG: TIGR03086 family metal-binding protein [Acidimicrobiales bacterium]